MQVYDLDLEPRTKGFCWWWWRLMMVRRRRRATKDAANGATDSAEARSNRSRRIALNGAKFGHYDVLKCL